MTAIVAQDQGVEKKIADVQGGETEGGEVKTGEESVPIPQPPATLSTASLYVGDLAPSVDESKLKAKFSEIGHVLSVRVCRDALTRQSLRYGYVNFENHKDAQKAMTDLNFELLDLQPMRIMWSERDPEKRRKGKGNLFIKNLGDHVDSKAIYDTFTMFGAILSCKVVLDENYKSKGYGFIHFEDEESAVQAIEKVNGMELDGKNIYVGPFMSRSKRHDLSEESYTNVFVKNFDEKIDEEKLKGSFSQYGTIKSAIVKQSPNGPPGKAYGFVDYEKHEDAVKAVSEMDGKEWEGNEIYVCRAMNKAERLAYLRNVHSKREKEAEMRNRSNLYVRFYDAITSDEGLKQLFEPYGPITSAKVMRDEHGCSRYFGFVNFANETDARRALLEMDHKLINGKPIHVAMALSKHKRQEMLQAMKDVYQNQMQKAAPLYARQASQLPAPMNPIQQVRITPGAYGQFPRSMSVSYPPTGLSSQPMMRAYHQPINYAMGYPAMNTQPILPYGQQMHRPVQQQQQQQQQPQQSYANVTRMTMQGSSFTTVPPVQHSQMDVKSKEIGVPKTVGEGAKLG